VTPSADDRRPVVVHEIAPQDWERFRQIRLRALADSPFAFSSTVQEEEARPETDWRERLAHPGRVTFAAIDGDRWVGIAGVFVLEDQPSIAHLVSMWVDPGARRGGVGTLLITRALEWAQASGMRRLDLWVTETNEPALRLYAASGFVRGTQRQLLASNSALTEVIMHRPLP
jgi:GNAT superfamily N-acetyltransferase